MFFIAANNHYAGFGPGTANIFRNMLGLSDAKWDDKKEEEEHEPQQQQLAYPTDDFKQSILPEFLGIADDF